MNSGDFESYRKDALGRLTSKDLPGSEPDAAYGYDLLGRTTSAVQNGITIGFTYDALGRQLTQTIPIASIASPTFTSEYDLAGRRTRLTWPVDASGPTAYYVDYDYLVTGDMLQVRENGATTGAGVLATFAYDDLGRRTSLTRGNGTVTSYGYDAVSRLSQLSHDFAGTTHDLTLTFAYNPASQIVSSTRSNDLYAWNGHGSGTTASTADGLNRLASHGSATPAYDARGNMTSDGTSAYAYTSENLLASAGASGPLDYDPLMRFYRNYTTYFIHDTGSASGAGGGQLIGDYYDGSIANRYVPGPGVDEPLVSVSKTGARTWFHADERGSIIAGSDGAGANARIILYDENGKRGGGGSYRFAFTGQVHLINDIYDYKSRNYNARLGRFMQADPIGYMGGMNLYAYVGGDPVNFIDPFGFKRRCASSPDDDIAVCGRRSASGGGAALLGASRGHASGAELQPGPYADDPHAAVCGNADCSEAIVTAPTTKTRFYFNGRAWVWNPHYVDPWYSTYVDYGTGILFAGPVALIVGAETLGALSLEVAVVRFAPSAKHLASAGGRWAKFNTNSVTRIRSIVYQALKSSSRTITAQADGRYRIVADLGKVIGTNGQTTVRVVVSSEGEIITAFPGM